MTSTGPKAATRAVVLAGGQGKRMKSARPKVLHDLLGRPIISRILDTLDELHLEHIHIIVGHQSEKLISYLKEHPPATPYSTHLQEPQLGTAHALLQAAPALDGFSGTVLVLAADTPLLNANTLHSLIKKHRDQKDAITVLTSVVEQPADYGRVVRDRAGNISLIVEAKDAGPEETSIREINTGVYCLEWLRVGSGCAALKNTNKQKEFYLTDLIGWANENNLSVGGYSAADNFDVLGINSTEQLSQCLAIMRYRKMHELTTEHGVTIIDPQSCWISPEVKVGTDTTILPGCYLVGNIRIGSGCEIGPNTTMHGDCTVGDNSSVIHSYVVDSQIGTNCIVGPFAHLRDGSKIEDKVLVGNFVEVARTTIDSDSKAKHLSYLGDSQVGKSVNIGAGTIIANYDSVNKEKAKTIIGDRASTGSNSVLVSPVKVGDEALIAAGTVVSEDIPAGALAIGRTPQENKPGWVAEKKKRRNKK
jgi:bifunctional UDP-N-acetylglucosamine pyrophosphorylase / glucosamine-1-phosphate N-acetyltransferase